MKNTLETKLGLFFALAMIAAFILFEMVGGSNLFKRNYELNGRFANVQELKVGDPVKMAGVEVGRVDKIGFENDKVKVSMKINEGVDVKTDSKATIKFAGLMGQNFVSINLGTAPTKFENGATIETLEQADLSAIMAKLDNVATGIENVTKSFSGDSLQNVLGPMTDFLKDNNPKISAILGNLQNVSTQMAEGKGTMGKILTDESLFNDAKTAVNTLNTTAEDIKVAIGEARTIVGNANRALGQAEGALVDARKVVADINEGKGSLGKMLKDETLYTETTTAMVNLKEILVKINSGQGSVGKLVNDESFYKNVKMTLQKVEKATEGLEDTGPLSVLGTAVNSLF
ncbi:MAG: Mammalian cell entry related domain protein [Verrucomicrobia bacterium]|jgi:phospholipid/cholesterol/gamma-HCH transport system substrate-binding protein|nr:Mammalian cell entry related domain protein [Verrucomicrobiota bacterium]